MSDDMTVLPEHPAGWVGRPGRKVAGRSALVRTVPEHGSRPDLQGRHPQLNVSAGNPVTALRMQVEIQLAPPGLVRRAAP
jgi:hypothetical protein